MAKRTVFILATAALLVAWLLLRTFPPEHRTSGREPRLAPDFALTDLSGARVSLSDYRGKVVLLDFWATWCAPCKTEIPQFIEMQNRYGPRGFQVIGISMDDDEKQVHEFQRQFKMNYPVAIGNADLASQYGGILGLPIAFVIDSDGHIVSRHVGQTDTSVFEAEIQTLLAVSK